VNCGFDPALAGDHGKTTEREDAVSEKEERELSPEEVEQQDGEELPDREAMSLITAPGQPAVAPFEPPALDP
jgi:hypothetical protein